MFYRVAQLSVVVGGLACPLLCAHVYWFVICFDLVWSSSFFFFGSWFLCCCVSVGVLHLTNALILRCKAGCKARAPK